MGIDDGAVRFLAEARQRGVDFSRTLTIGRQQVYGGGRAGRATAIAVPRRGWAEPLFHSLGAAVVDSLDNSDYEGATLLGDLNSPLPAAWAERYTVVYDGGTLEHVFDVPAALANLMRLVSVGGQLLGAYPASGQVGHGLYQFSPELFLAALRPDNGFRVDALFVSERSRWTRGTRRWWEVERSPDGLRMELSPRRPAELYVLATRLGSVPDRLLPAAQRDYEQLWAAPARPRLSDRLDDLPWPAPAVVAEVARRRRQPAGFRRR